MNITILLLGFILSLGCTKDQGEVSVFVVKAMLIEYEEFEGVFLHELVSVTNSLEGVERPVSNALVQLSDDVNTVRLLESAIPGKYIFGSDSIVFRSEVKYKLLIEVEGQTITSETRIPKHVFRQDEEYREIQVDSLSTGAQMFTLDWTENNSGWYSLGMKAPVIAQEIPFSVQSGNFASRFEYPISFSSASVFDTDFKYYGLHEISVYSIDDDYEVIYYYPRFQDVTIIHGPDNVIGGSGFFYGASKTTWKVNVE